MPDMNSMKNGDLIRQLENHIEEYWKQRRA